MQSPAVGPSRRPQVGMISPEETGFGPAPRAGCLLVSAGPQASPPRAATGASCLCSGASREGHSGPMEDGFRSAELAPGIVVAAVGDGHGSPRKSKKRPRADATSSPAKLANPGQTCAEAIVGTVRRLFAAPAAGGLTDEAAERLLRRGFAAAEEALQPLAGCGAVAAAVVVDRDRLHVAGLGDCLVLGVRTDGGVEVLLRPHRANNPTEYSHHLDALASPEELAWLRQRPAALTRILGGRQPERYLLDEPEVVHLEAAALAGVILCTDGVHDYLPPEEIEQHLRRKPLGPATAAELVRLAVTRCYSTDDVAVVCLRLQ